jgi:hypothetical protein
MVRLSCRATLIKRFGPNYGLVTMRLDLAEGCPKITAKQITDLCEVIYPNLIGR